MTSFSKTFDFNFRRYHQKNFLWASQLWIGRRKEPILGYVLKNDEKKNSGSNGLNNPFLSTNSRGGLKFGFKLLYICHSPSLQMQIEKSVTEDVITSLLSSARHVKTMGTHKSFMVFSSYFWLRHDSSTSTAKTNPFPL